MPILALGVSYRRAPVELLERLAFPPGTEEKAYRMLLELPAVAEAVVLSTCNRVEVFAEVASYHAGFQEVKRFLAESRGVAPDEFAEPLYSHYETHAAEHLFSVAAGIDSVVLGEPQILTQVRQAYRRAESEGGAGSVLGRLFRAAIRTGKRAREETRIGAAPEGFIRAGTAMAERTLGGLSGRPATVVGAGSMASLAVAHLRERGMEPIRIVNRSPERARRLAERAGAEPVGLDLLARAIAGADLVVCSTGATGTVVGPAEVREALDLRRGRRDGRLFLLDLAVPRDVDPSVGDVAGVFLADLDDLNRVLVDGRGGQAREVERVRAVVAEEVERFEAWRRAARLAPFIQALRDRGDRIRAAELARFASRLTELSPREREAVEAVARGIVAKLLHDPIVRLKRLSGPAAGDAHVRALAELFDIPFAPGDPTP